MSHLKTDKAAELCRKLPNASTRALARMLQEKMPKSFPTYDSARAAVRHARGSIKCRTIQRVENTRHTAGGIKLPPSHAKPFEPHNIEGPSRCAIFSDIHLPYHDEEALGAAIAHARKWRADTILINGDMLDCCSVSTHEKDPEARDLAEELACGREFLALLKSKFPAARFIYRTGNHEDRLRKYVARVAPELLGLNEIRLEKLLGLSDLGIEFVTDKRIINLGKLPILHGHEFYSGMNSPVNAARGLFLRGKSSAVQGHLHQTSEHTETSLSAQTLTTWSIGCLCGLNPAYSPLASLRWNHGFMLVEVDARGMFEVNNLRLINGRFV